MRENYRKYIIFLIKKYRKTNKITIRKLADELFYSHSQISRFENGKHVPDIEILLDFLKKLNINIISDENILNTQENLLDKIKDSIIEKAIIDDKLWLEVENNKVLYSNSLCSYRYLLYEFVYNLSNDNYTTIDVIDDLVELKELYDDEDKEILDTYLGLYYYGQSLFDKSHKYFLSVINLKHDNLLFAFSVYYNSHYLLINERYISIYIKLNEASQIFLKHNLLDYYFKSQMIIAYASCMAGSISRSEDRLVEILNDKKASFAIKKLAYNLLLRVYIRDDNIYKIKKLLENKDIYKKDNYSFYASLAYFALLKNDKTLLNYAYLKAMSIKKIKTKPYVFTFLKIIKALFEHNYEIIDDVEFCLNQVESKYNIEEYIILNEILYNLYALHHQEDKAFKILNKIYHLKQLNNNVSLTNTKIFK